MVHIPKQCLDEYSKHNKATKYFVDDHLRRLDFPIIKMSVSLALPSRVIFTYLYFTETCHYS